MKNNSPICGSYIPGNGLTEAAAAKIDFTKITHCFLAFSTLAEKGEGMYIPTFSQKLINGIDRAKEVIAEKNAATKLLVSIGGWGAGYFCEAAGNAENRVLFAEECARLSEKYGLDGIDMDWEFPGVASQGVNACPNCPGDFILLLREMRKAMPHKLITAAVGSDHWDRLDNISLNEILDYVNVMTYDMNTFAHCSMDYTKRAMEGWASHGIDAHKLVLGVPFYARCENPEYEWRGYSELCEMCKSGEAQFLSTADQEYVVIDGNRLSIDTPRSIGKKCQYIRERGFAGIFNWQELTDSQGQLRNAMFEEINI